MAVKPANSHYRDSQCCKCCHLNLSLTMPCCVMENGPGKSLKLIEFDDCKCVNPVLTVDSIITKIRGASSTSAPK